MMVTPISTKKKLSELQSLCERVSQATQLSEERIPMENWVFEGGGVKGLAMLAAIKEAIERDVLNFKELERVAGSSAGGILAIFLTLGCTPDEMEMILKELDFEKFMDSRVKSDPTRRIIGPILARLFGTPPNLGISDIYMLFKNKGIFKGDVFVEKMQELVIKILKDKLKSIPEMEGKNLSNITFGQLLELVHKYPKLGFKALYLTGTGLSHNVIFSAETSPYMKIIDALRITIGYPFFFEPKRYQDQFYIDGGTAFVRNFPISIFNQSQFLTHGVNDAGENRATFGFRVDSEDEIDELKPKKPKKPIKRGLRNTIKAWLLRSDIPRLRKMDPENFIQINDQGIPTMKLNITPEEQEKLARSGREAVAQFAEANQDRAKNAHIYKNSDQKYNSKNPQELRRIVEKSLYPLLLEIQSMQQRGLDLDKLQALEMKMHKELDIALIALAAHDKNYLDPRTHTRVFESKPEEAEKRFQQDKQSEQHSASKILNTGSTSSEAASWLEATRLIARLKREPMPPIKYIAIGARNEQEMIACLGAFEKMHDSDRLKSIEAIAASSWGALIAGLYAIGYTPDELVAVFKEKNVTDLRDPIFLLSGLGTLFKIKGIEVGVLELIALFSKKGICKGDKLEHFIETLFSQKMVEKLKKFLLSSLSDLEKELLLNASYQEIDVYLESKLESLKTKHQIEDWGKITFGQLSALGQKYPDLQLKALHITGTSVRDGSSKVFCAESDPEMPISKAMRISMSDPVRFVPAEYKGEFYIAGGIASPCPMRVFDEPQYRDHGLDEAQVNPCTLGFMGTKKREEEAYWRSGTTKEREPSFFSFVKGIIKTLSPRSEVLNKYGMNIIHINTGVAKIKTLDSAATQRLLQKGRKATGSYQKLYHETDPDGSNVLYRPSQYESYDNFMQKYYSKSALELKRVLETEVKPLLAQYKALTPQLNQNREAQFNYKCLREEEEFIQKVLDLKKVPYPVVNESQKRERKSTAPKRAGLLSGG